MEPHEFIRICAAALNKNYSGDPLSLESFIDSIELLETIATTELINKTLFAFAKTKLEGRAREFITNDIINLANLKTRLRENIKPDNSKIIEGRMLNLKLNINTSSEFAQKIDELSDALRRTLIIEGITPPKANEMVIEKTVEMCRRNTHSDLIKSVLEATEFKSPKDVVAKLITQIDKSRTEHQILSYHANTNNNRFNNGNNNRRGRIHNNLGNRNYYRPQNSNTQYYNRYRNNSNNYGRGRGRGSHTNTYNYNNSSRRFNRHTNQGYPQNNFVRTFTNQGNQEPASQLLMGPGQPQIQQNYEQ